MSVLEGFVYMVLPTSAGLKTFRQQAISIFERTCKDCFMEEVADRMCEALVTGGSVQLGVRTVSPVCELQRGISCSLRLTGSLYQLYLSEQVQE